MFYHANIIPMHNEYKLQAILGVWGGIVFFALGFFIIRAPGNIYVYFGQLIIFWGYVLCVCGCLMYMKGKGYHWAVGLLGILGPLGLLILYLLKDRSKIAPDRKKKLKTFL